MSPLLSIPTIDFIEQIMGTVSVNAMQPDFEEVSALISTVRSELKEARVAALAPPEPSEAPQTKRIDLD